MDNLEEKFKRELDNTTWNDLKYHVAHDRCLFLEKNADIITTAIAISKDDTKYISNLLGKKVLQKPSIEIINSWKEVNLQCLIIYPYVLVQEH